MLVRVARAFGRDPHAVAAEPFVRTAWTFLTLLEVERMDELSRDAAALHGASLTAVAFHEPKKLEDERRRLLARTRPRRSSAEVLARARARIARIERGQVLDG